MFSKYPSNATKLHFVFQTKVNHHYHPILISEITQVFYYSVHEVYPAEAGEKRGEETVLSRKSRDSRVRDGVGRG